MYVFHVNEVPYCTNKQKSSSALDINFIPKTVKNGNVVSTIPTTNLTIAKISTKQKNHFDFFFFN